MRPRGSFYETRAATEPRTARGPPGHPRHRRPRLLACKRTGAAYSEIGRHFGGRNHSTAISAEKKVAGWLREQERNAFLAGFGTIADVLAALEQTLGT